MQPVPFWGIECLALEVFGAFATAIPQLGGPLLSWWTHAAILGCI